MTRFTARMMIAGLTSFTVLVGAAGASDEIEGLMKSIAGGKASPHKVLKKLLAAPEADWAAIAPETKKYEEGAAKLGAMKHEKGDQKSWDKLCKEFTDAAKELNAAAGKKDKKATDAAYAKLTESCEVCHEAHR